MLKRFFAIATLINLMGCGGLNQAASTLSTHKNIAILPFEISFDTKPPRTSKFTEQEMRELERYMSIALQEHLYENLKKRQKRFPYTVTIQSIDVTNNALASKNISFAALFTSSKKELCKILNVDAVLLPQAIFAEKSIENIKQLTYPGKLEVNIRIYDSITTNSVWKYNYILERQSISGKYGAENKYQDILIPWASTIDMMFENFTADFPYKRK